MVKNMSRFPLSTLLQLIIIIIREEGRLPLPLSTSEYYMERPLNCSSGGIGCVLCTQTSHDSSVLYVTVSMHT